MDLGFPTIDCDQHYYEPRDAFTRHMAKKHLPLAVHTAVDADGVEHTYVGDKVYDFTRPFFDAAVKPGGLRELLQSMKSGKVTDGHEIMRHHPPEIIEPAERVKLLEAQHVDAAFMLPSLGVCVEHLMDDNVEATYANLDSFNRWIEEEWGFGFAGRTIGVPLISLLDVGEACRQIDDLIERGSRVFHLRSGPVGRPHGKSPAHPDFDPFWSRVNEAGLVCAMHVAENGYNQYFSTLWGEDPNPNSHYQSAWQWTCSYGDKPIMDTVASMMFMNLFNRFPNLKMVTIELGSLWVPYILAQMNKMGGMGRNGPWPGGKIDERPAEIFKRHFWVSPYHEEKMEPLIDLIGADHVVFGSDFPHAEGLADPNDFATPLRNLGPDVVRQVMRGNAAGLLGVPG